MDKLEQEIIKDMKNEGKIMEFFLLCIAISFIVALTVLFVK